MKARLVALVLLVVGVGLAGLGVRAGFQGLTSLDGVACPAVFGEDRLVTVLTGKDSECDATREAQSMVVYSLLGLGGVVLLGSLVVWSSRFVRRERVRAGMR